MSPRHTPRPPPLHTPAPYPAATPPSSSHAARPSRASSLRPGHAPRPSLRPCVHAAACSALRSPVSHVRPAHGPMSGLPALRATVAACGRLVQPRRVPTVTARQPLSFTEAGHPIALMAPHLAQIHLDDPANIRPHVLSEAAREAAGDGAGKARSRPRHAVSLLGEDPRRDSSEYVYEASTGADPGRVASVVWDGGSTVPTLRIESGNCWGR
jgi:hypothetical protein